MATRMQAISKARRMAKKSGETTFVVRECGEFEAATDFDCDTFFFGAPIECAVEPDGEVASHW